MGTEVGTGARARASTWLGCLVAVCLALGCGRGVPVSYTPQVGDVLFQSLPRDALVDVIEGVSGSPFSHCGIVDRVDGEFVVLEAFRTVRAVQLTKFLARGRDGRFAVYRWKPEAEAVIPDVLAAVHANLGRPYDLHYSMDDEALYCSELIWKAYRDATGESLCDTHALRELNWKPYEQAIRQMEDGTVPLARQMVTPAALAQSGVLMPVLYHGF